MRDKIIQAVAKMLGRYVIVAPDMDELLLHFRKEFQDDMRRRGPMSREVRNLNATLGPHFGGRGGPIKPGIYHV